MLWMLVLSFLLAPLLLAVHRAIARRFNKLNEENRVMNHDGPRRL